MLCSDLLADFSDVIEHGFGNRNDFDLLVSDKNTVIMKQVHGNDINIIKSNFDVKECDSLVTQVKNIKLCVKTADCIPILLYDSRKKVVAAVHCGRAGLEKHILTKTISAMEEEYNTDSDDIIAVLGPAVSEKHYSVDKKTFNRFVECTEVKQTGCKINLKAAAEYELLQNGISKKNIDDIEICTFEDIKFNSYRRDKTDQRQISFIALKNNG